GELIRSVVFERREQTPTANGGLAEAWLPVASVRARIKALFGGADHRGRADDGARDHAVTVR
ncbi:MAG: phage head completion protein, partial [Allosphingosinicella sp.]